MSKVFEIRVEEDVDLDFEIEYSLFGVVEGNSPLFNVV